MSYSCELCRWQHHDRHTSLMPPPHTHTNAPFKHRRPPRLRHGKLSVQWCWANQKRQLLPPLCSHAEVPPPHTHTLQTSPPPVPPPPRLSAQHAPPKRKTLEAKRAVVKDKPDTPAPPLPPVPLPDPLPDPPQPLGEPGCSFAALTHPPPPCYPPPPTHTHTHNTHAYTHTHHHHHHHHHHHYRSPPPLPITPTGGPP